MKDAAANARTQEIVNRLQGSWSDGGVVNEIIAWLEREYLTESEEASS